MGVIIEWFVAGDDEQAATVVHGRSQLERFPTVRVGLNAMTSKPSLEAILTGRTVDEVWAARDDTLVAQLGDGDVSVVRLSSALVRSVGAVEDDAIPVVARSWATASGDEPDEAEARWILEQVVPIFRRANAEGLHGYEFGCV